MIIDTEDVAQPGHETFIVIKNKFISLKIIVGWLNDNHSLKPLAPIEFVKNYAVTTNRLSKYKKMYMHLYHPSINY